MDEEVHEFLIALDWESFREEIRKILSTCNPRDVKVILLDSISDPVKTHINALATLTVSLASPTAHALSAKIGVAGCG